MAQVKARDVASDLRMLADALDREPDTLVPRVEVDFDCRYGYVIEEAKAMFISLAHLLPKPLAKSVRQFDKESMELRYTSPAMILTTEVKRTTVCKLIEPEKVIPAVYECEPLLSAAEEAAFPEMA